MRHAIGLLALLCGCGSLAAEPASPNACAARSGTTTVPLVELYTSEGCSSCPPADRWLSSRLRDDDANFLAFHVDYWDDIGWPDRFGSPDFARRQRARVGASGGSTVYTPQVMVGEHVRVNWHDSGAWTASLRQARQPARASLALRLLRTDAGWQAIVAAAPNGPAGEDAQVWLARYVDGQSTAVRAGENRGATLRHDRVVLKISGPWPLGSGTQTQRVDLPEEKAAWGVTAFIQNGRGELLQSLNLPATGCASGAAES